VFYQSFYEPGDDRLGLKHVAIEFLQ